LMPVIQLVVLSFTATFELQNVKFYAVDYDRSEITDQLVRKFQANEYYTLVGQGMSESKTREMLSSGEIDMALIVPPAMDRKISKEQSVRVMLMIDAVSSNKASLIQSYSRSIIQDFNRSILPEYHWFRSQPRVAGISTHMRIWYNPTLDYINYMVPGILVVLITMIALFLSGMNIVREKEIGTMEQLNVTPIRKSEFIISKLLPMWMLALVELTIGLLIAYWGFGVPFEGSILTVYSASALYLVAVQGIGLYVSTVTYTQQQAMFISWFMMVIFILMGGLFTPIESMPLWAQKLTYINPVAYFIDIMRMVMLKGSGYPDFWPQMIALSIFAIASVSFSIKQYSKIQQD